MSIDLTAIRGAIASTLKAKVDREINTYEGYIPGAPLAPCVIVHPSDPYIENDETMCGKPSKVNFDLWILTNPGAGTDGQRVVDDLLSQGAGKTNSLFDALTEDRTLQGRVSHLEVGNARYRDRMTWGGTADSQVLFDWAELAVTVQMED